MLQINNTQTNIEETLRLFNVIILLKTIYALSSLDGYWLGSSLPNNNCWWLRADATETIWVTG